MRHLSHDFLLRTDVEERSELQYRLSLQIADGLRRVYTADSKTFDKDFVKDIMIIIYGEITLTADEHRIIIAPGIVNHRLDIPIGNGVTIDFPFTDERVSPIESDIAVDKPLDLTNIVNNSDWPSCRDIHLTAPIVELRQGINRRLWNTVGGETD